MLSVLPVVSIERTVFYREKAAGMYSPLSYAFAQVISLLITYLKSIIRTYFNLVTSRTT